MNKELEKRIEERARYIFNSFKKGTISDTALRLSIPIYWVNLAKQTLIWELEARIEECDEHWTKGNVRLNQLQSELKMLKGE